MSIELVRKYAPYTDEIFSTESKISLLTNTNYDWSGAHSVLIWKLGTVPLNDYARKRGFGDEFEPESVSLSRFGEMIDLSAQTQEQLLSKDRSFIFNVDKLDTDETAGQLEAGTALARELREVVVPEVDKHTFNAMVTGAGKVVEPTPLTKANVYTAILAGSEVLDEAEVPDTERVLVVTPSTYTLLKQATEFDNTDVGAEMKLKGVVGILDGMAVVKVPANRLPAGFGFMIAHPSATVSPVKLEDYGVHNDTVLSSGSIVTGRIAYDAFVLDNKKNGIYYHPIA
ncbi:hypothetical protein LJC61_09010 [Ruminococcaceae bacterium OttesenSCG-928-A16]|nr:hypothetical protein [Ruminococcaceae bacterium OttesenSCG-928-A16]